MIGNKLIVGIAAEIGTGHEVDILAEREATEVVRIYNTVEYRVSLLETHNGRTCKDDLHLRVLIMDELELFAPIWILEDLIDQQRTTTLLLELRDELTQSVGVEVEVVHIDVETTTVVWTILLESILQQECSLTYTSATLNADQAATPINLVYKLATYRRVDVLYQILMSSIKCLHRMIFITNYSLTDAQKADF